jgi:hypothetical protein
MRYLVKCRCGHTLAEHERGRCSQCNCDRDEREALEAALDDAIAQHQPKYRADADDADH